MTIEELIRPPTEREVAALNEAAKDGLTDAGRAILRRILFQRDTLLAKVEALEARRIPLEGQ